MALTWPHRLSGMGTPSGLPIRRPASTGRRELRAESHAPHPPDTANVEAPVLARHREAVSKPARLVVR
jgi:hypothetical protein